MIENAGNTQTINTAEFTETPRLVLEQPVGDVAVEGWDRPEIQVTTTDGEDTFDVEVSGSQVLVRNRPKRLRLNEMLEPAVRELNNFGLDMDRMASRVERQVERSMRKMRRGFNVNIDLGNWSSSHDYRIKVPHNCDLMLRTSSGDLNVKDVQGTIYTQSTSGDVRMQRIAGNLLVTSSSGDIEIHELNGKLGAKSASGDIRLERADLQELGVHTASGDIDATLLRVPERDFDVRTVSGDLDVSLPASSSLTVEMSTISGDLHCRFPHELTRRSGKRMSTLLINGGGNNARFASVSGDVTLRPLPGMDKAAVADEAGAPTTGLSQGEAANEGASGDITEPEGYMLRRQAELDILEAVQGGEISAQDAMQRLSDLDR